MLELDAYRPDEWRDFFVMVGGSAAALTGLIFVALSVSVHAITKDASHRYRALDTIAGMAGVFVVCALVLMGGQDHRAVGIEWLVVAAGSLAVLIYGYTQARRGGSKAWLRSRRSILLGALYLAEMAGAALLIAGYLAGLYLAAVAMVAALAFMITAAWLLVVGGTVREPEALDRSQ
jgi:small-conductance mechanosensitive channel